MVKVRVQVLQEDIDNGTKKCINTCPVALALSHVGIDADVTPDYIDLLDDEGFYRGIQVKTCNSVLNFIKMYDWQKHTRKTFFIHFDVLKDEVAKKFNINPEKYCSLGGINEAFIFLH